MNTLRRSDKLRSYSCRYLQEENIQHFCIALCCTAMYGNVLYLIKWVRHFLFNMFFRHFECTKMTCIVLIYRHTNKTEKSISVGRRKNESFAG